MGYFFLNLNEKLGIKFLLKIIFGYIWVKSGPIRK